MPLGAVGMLLMLLIDLISLTDGVVYVEKRADVVVDDCG